MKMRRVFKRSKQIAGGVLIVLSLLASSVAACVCAHHAEKVEAAAASCHGHEETPPQKTGAPENIARLDANDECGCVQPAPRVFSKSETVKLEKQTAALPSSPVEIVPAAPPATAKNVYFEKPFYLSDSFYNLKSPRAPPAA
jgi:hypothetical protein